MSAVIFSGWALTIVWSLIMIGILIPKYILDKQLEVHPLIIPLKNKEQFNVGHIIITSIVSFIAFFLLGFIWPVIPVAIVFGLIYLMIRGLRFIARLCKELNVKSKF